MFFLINNTNNEPVCLQSIRLPLAVSLGIPLDFHWLCPLEFHRSWSFLVAGLLLVHWQSIRKVHWTERSCHKCLDQLRKIIGKILWSKSQKNIHSAYPKSNRVCSEKQWECKDLCQCTKESQLSLCHQL